ncbi:MAG: DNA primase [Elainellaceae cyanobacterium]
MDVPRLHPDTIEQVKERADIVDVVSEHVVLKKRGKDFVGLCPFHDDRSPSFTVSPSKQFYYCFSCGAGGNAIKFLMEHEQRSFSEVVLGLGRRFGVTVQTLEPAQRQAFQKQLSRREKLYEILAIATSFFQHALHQSEGRAALDYLTARGLDAATAQKFQLGYAPGGWQTLYGYMVEQKRYPVALIEQAGLIVPRSENKGYYDRFRDRLMIPICDPQGRVIGFGGRTLTDEQPKYLNSPETELFDKGQTLFGLDKARAAISKADAAIVVEGYFDVIALHTAGITHAVASLGTALNLQQVKQLLRYTESKQVILNFDDDGAGTRATERAIEEVTALAYRGDAQLRVLNLPSGKDPDEFLRAHSPDAYRDLVQNAPLWLDWQIDQAFTGHDLSQAQDVQQVTQQLVTFLGQVTNATTRTHYGRVCAERLSQGDPRLVPLLVENLLAQVRRQRRRSPKGDEMPRLQVQPTKSLDCAEATLLRIYIHASSHRSAIVDALEQRDLQFSLSHHRLLWRKILELEEQTPEQIPEQTLEASVSDNPASLDPPTNAQIPLLTCLRDTAAETDGLLDAVSHLLQLDEKTKRDVLRAPLVISRAVDRLERIMCEKRCQHFQRLWEQTDLATEPAMAQHYQEQIEAEKRRMQQLDEQYSATFEDLANVPWVGEYYAELERLS